MERIFVTDIHINKVRHLSGVEIPLSDHDMRHLIITGKNGSGKTSLLDAISVFLDVITDNEDIKYDFILENDSILNVENKGSSYNTLNRLMQYEERFENIKRWIALDINRELTVVSNAFHKGEFVVAYYRADRIFKAEIPKHVEKVELKNGYLISETPREEFVKYLLDQKMTEALARSNGKNDKAEKIKQWFDKFQNLLSKIFEDDSLRLNFDEDTFRFSICIEGREPFDFNTMSSGYAAILDIVVDLIIRMEGQSKKVFDFSVPGIVLIDEIETHLHLELQKKILALLTTIFPNVQFILSTHSPFVLNSLENVIIYDLENKLLVQNNLANVPYSGIVEGYFNANEMSATLESKFLRYKVLADKQNLTDEDIEEIADLELYLDEIPDYLALNITTEYQRIKQKLRGRF